MNLNSRIIELQRKYISLSEAVKVAQKFPASDHFWVVELKKKNCYLKKYYDYHKYSDLFFLLNLKTAPREVAVDL